MLWAMSSLPVPGPPYISTGRSVRANFFALFITDDITPLSCMMSENVYPAADLSLSLSFSLSRSAKAVFPGFRIRIIYPVHRELSNIGVLFTAHRLPATMYFPSTVSAWLRQFPGSMSYIDSGPFTVPYDFKILSAEVFFSLMLPSAPVSMAASLMLSMAAFMYVSPRCLSACCAFSMPSACCIATSTLSCWDSISMPLQLRVLAISLIRASPRISVIPFSLNTFITSGTSSMLLTVL